MSFWQDFQTALDKAVTAVWSEVQTIAREIEPMALATAEDVAQIALGAVMQQAPLVLSGTVKLANATATVINTLATQGKAVVAGQAEAAVQTAYNDLSAKLAAAKAATPAVPPAA